MIFRGKYHHLLKKADFVGIADKYKDRFLFENPHIYLLVARVLWVLNIIFKFLAFRYLTNHDKSE